MKKLIWFFFLISLSCRPVMAFVDSVKIVKDLRTEWLVYNSSHKNYIPYLTSAKNTYCVYNWILLKNYWAYTLNFNAAPNTILFVNNRIWYQNLSNDQEKVTIKLSDVEGPKNGRNSLFAIYNPNNVFPNYAYIGYAYYPQKKAIKDGILVSRSINTSINYNIGLGLTLIALITLLKNRYPKYYSSLIGFNEVPLEDFHEQTFINYPLILFVLINSVVFTCLFLLLTQYIDTPGLVGIELLKLDSLLNIIYLCCFFIVALLAKLIYLWFVSGLFNLFKVVKIQFYEVVKVIFRFNLLLLFAFFITLGYWHILPFSIPRQIVLIAAFVFSGAIVLRILFLFVRINLHRNIYLFSYLCISEILPLLVIMKLFCSSL